MSSPSLDGSLVHDGEVSDGPPVVAGRFDGEHVLVPLLTREGPVLADQLKVATALARATGASLTVIDPISVPERTPGTYHHQATEGDDVAPLERVFEGATGSLPQVDGDLVHTRNVVRGVLRAVRRRDIDTLIVPGSRQGRLRRGATERIAAHADADVVVVNGQSGFGKVASILLPVAGGPHSGLAADVAASIAADCGAWIDVLHVVDEDPSDRRRARATDLVEDVSRRVARPETTSTWVLEAPDTTEAIVEQSRYYGLTVIGAPTKGRLRRLVFGSTNDSVRANADSVVLSARNNSAASASE